jgi:hypothetical protein
MAKDFTKYNVIGIAINLNKSRLVYKVIENFINTFQDDYIALKEIWNDKLQGGKGVVKLVSEVDASNERNYFMDSIFSLNDGSKIVVCNQWGKENLPNFIAQAIKIGYQIKPIDHDSDETQEIEINTTENTKSKFPENYFKEYFSKEGEDLKLVINIYGSLHQLFQCRKEEEEEIEEVENHYENTLSAFFKIDSDNLITIELNGEKILEGEVSDLGINETELKIVSKTDPISLEKVAGNLGKISNFKPFSDIDMDNILISKKNNLLVINDTSGALGYRKALKYAPECENRYTMVEYGKYHIQTYPVNLKRFKISDLFFQKDTGMEDLIGNSSEGIYYCFSKIFHIELNELEYEIQNSNVRSTEFLEGWMHEA